MLKTGNIHTDRVDALGLNGAFGLSFHHNIIVFEGKTTGLGDY